MHVPAQRSSVGAVKAVLGRNGRSRQRRKVNGHLCIDDDGCHTSTFARAVRSFPVVSPAILAASRSWQGSFLAGWVSNDRRVCKAPTALRVMLSRCRSQCACGSALNPSRVVSL